MNYDAHYLWEKRHDRSYNPVSVVLQQVEYGKKQILFACVCESGIKGQEGVTESGYFSERMTEWFHKRYLKLYAKNRNMQAATDDLLREYTMLLYELEKIQKKNGCGCALQLCLVLLQENQFIMLKRGMCSIFLINKRFNTQQIKQWEQFDEKGFCQGRIQRNLGVLLCTDAYGQAVIQDGCREAFFLDKKTEDWRLGKRLAEVWQDIERTGQTEAVGAVYICTG